MAYHVTHRIQQRETLQSIATTKLGDVSQWKTLMSLNHLDFPYIVKTHKQKAEGLTHKDSTGHLDPQHWLTFGDEIALPLTNGTSRNSVPKAVDFTPKQEYDATLGMDLKLGFNLFSKKGGVNYGDQVAYLKPNHRGNEVQTVSGIQNLLQSFTLRLITQYGTLPYHPHYGSHLNEYIGQPIHANGKDTCDDISVEIQRVADTDPRINECDIKECRLLNDNFFAVAAIKPVDPYPRFSMYIDSVNGGYINTGLTNER